MNPFGDQFQEDTVKRKSINPPQKPEKPLFLKSSTNPNMVALTISDRNNERTQSQPLSNPFEDQYVVDSDDSSSMSDSPPSEELLEARNMYDRIKSSPTLVFNDEDEDADPFGDKKEQRQLKPSKPVNIPPRLPPRPTTNYRSPTSAKSAHGKSLSNIIIPSPSLFSPEELESGTPTLSRAPSIASSIFQPPPPLPDRPRRAVQSSLDLTENERTKEKGHLPDTSDVYRGIPVANYLTTADIFHKGAMRCFCYSGYYAITGSSNIRIWYLPSAENRYTIPIPENKPIIACSFVTATNLDHEGNFVWVSIAGGEVWEIDVKQGEIITKSNQHSSTVTHIIRGRRSMITIDELGGLKIWPAAEGRSVLNSRPRALRISTKTLHACLINELHLWTAQAKAIEIYSLVDGNVSSITEKKIDLGVKVSCMTALQSRNEIYAALDDKNIVIFDTVTMEKKQVYSITHYKITALHAFGDMLWIGMGIGKILVLNISDLNLWKCQLDFLAYTNSGVTGFMVDDNSLSLYGHQSIISVSEGGHMRIWDGSLSDYKRDIQMNARRQEFSSHTPIDVVIVSYNLDSRKPIDMDTGDQIDRTFLQDFISNNSADIYVFGFQELIDLENKSANAKTFLSGTKKSNSVEHKMDQRLKLWQERLLHLFPKSVEVVKVSQLVGLFQCIISRKTFVLRDTAINYVKTGLKGLHGNKGAITSRFVIGDSSFCFVNCHLAAHQNNTSDRNNNINQILKEASFPKIPDCSFLWERGGDGSMISDHEYVFWNGDLNYRINNLTRDQVVDAATEQNWPLLWQNDQLLIQKQTNPGFGLKAFQEGPLQFAPTFKYNRNSNIFDTSEKKRIPAYCDRILWRGHNVKQHFYQRLECKMSDHRPVASKFTAYVKSVDSKKYQVVEADVTHKQKQRLAETVHQANIDYLCQTFLVSASDAKDIVAKCNGNLREACRTFNIV
ncbi:hypothetical protein HDV01_000504 [Terramyces sp. JEL0728]|nr:hypothetical protein HDV01_000504 [Terramyces sp. JEL0728]